MERKVGMPCADADTSPEEVGGEAENGTPAF
jgi:hypothetical protein